MDRTAQAERKNKQSFLAVVAAVLVLCASCREPDVQIIVTPPPPPQEREVLFALIDGYWTGIKVFDLDSMQTIDSFYYPNNPPFSYVTSNDRQIWYSILYHMDNHTYSLATIDVASKIICRETFIKEQFLVSDHQQNYLITYYRRLQIHDRKTFSLIHEDSLGYVYPMVASPKEMKLYGVKVDGDVLIYDLEKFQVTDTIPLQERGGSGDLRITPDGKYLFVTVSYGLVNIGFFQAIDLTTRTVVAVHLCGSEASMGLSPDGKFVYLTDPAGLYHSLNPTGKLLRYNIETKTMEEFIDWVPYHLTEAYEGRLATDQIVVSPDNRYLYITPFYMDAKLDGKPIDIMKIEIATKQIVGILSLPVKTSGAIQHIFRLRLDKIKSAN